MSPELAEVVERVHRDLVAGAERPAGLAELADAAQRRVRSIAPLLSEQAVAEVVAAVAARTGGLGPLAPLLAEPEITEVMVNGPGPVWVERGGHLEATGVELDTRTIEHLIERIVGPLGLRVDRASPIADARLPDGSRVNAIVPPLAIDGPCLTIRRFGALAVPVEAFCPPGVAPLMRWAVKARCNVLISGGTGAGKTTLLNALAAAIPPGDRVITVEDAAELRIPLDHVVRLEARPANAEQAGAVSIRELVRNALRMRPDRIVIGEVRGAEALDMLQAMNTGHEGSLSTCHANSAHDALRRIETMVLTGRVALPIAAVRDQIDSALDFVVQVARRPSGARTIVEVAEVCEPGPGEPGTRVRRLAGPAGLVALPDRPARLPGVPPPDREWLAKC